MRLTACGRTKDALIAWTLDTYGRTALKIRGPIAMSRISQRAAM
jgi:hypothetical protein